MRLAGRVKTSPDELELFAGSLAGGDEVVLEATGNALAVTRVIESYVARVVLANQNSVKTAAETANTDKLDARTLAKLLASWRVRRRPLVLGRLRSVHAAPSRPSGPGLRRAKKCTNVSRISRRSTSNEALETAAEQGK